MFKKICYAGAFLFLCYSFTACHKNKSNHKNNDTKIKSAHTSASNLQMDPSKTIAENITRDTSYSILSESLKASGLSEILAEPGPFTFFAPTNTAFSGLPNGTLESLKERKNDLANILSHHVVAGLLRNKDLKGQKLKTLAGDELIVTTRNKEIIINGVKVNANGIKASNGTIYVIDNLLFPKDQNPGAY